MDKKRNVKQKLIFVVAVFILLAIGFLALGVAVFEDEKENQQAQDTYIQTQATVIEAGEVEETRGRYADGWRQQCVIEYKLSDGKIRQVNYGADNHTEQRALVVGSKIEILVSSDDYRVVQSAHEDSFPTIPTFIVFAVFGLGLYVALIIKYATEYKRSKVEVELQRKD